MAYADQKMSGGKVVAIVIVAMIHLALGYAFVTGLAYQYVKKATEKLNTFDVEEPPPPPPDEPPPPPPDTPVPPPPVVSPPPIVQNPNPPPVVVATVPTPPPAFVPTPIAAPPAPPAPAPAPSVVSKAAGAKGDETQWVTVDDYPASSLRSGEQGRSVIGWTINTAGRAEGCHTISSSGSSALDDAACRAITRRARYTPAVNAAGQPIATTKQRTVVWQVPKD